MKKILIANRGEIARRIQRTCREMGIASVAVFSDPDRDSLFVREADEAVPLGGSTPAESYLQIDKLLAAAARTSADAVHPGYGFLAENADFAQQCLDAGLTFIGPTPDAIRAMGSKIEAKRRMQAAGVPVLPSIDVTGQSPAQLLKEAQPLGFPLLVKASAGGGGRGMRIVHSAQELAAHVEAAGREALGAFGDATVFIEPYIESSRHVEIQIFGDTHGQVVHLFERECSIQRRHQKIVEEAPSVAVDDKLRAAMGTAAVQGGQAIGYVGAGTVEFLLNNDGKFYFLEVNTRLQVEHPVTECITGLDLVRLQILVAQGHPLPPEALHPHINGHAIEVRLYAEDPRRDFLPVTGRLDRFAIPAGPGVRVESGVTCGSEISPFYDPMLAKVIVHAPTRAEAAARLASTLARAEIHGPQNNRDLLVRILRHPEFLSGQTDTHFLVRHEPAQLGASLLDEPSLGLHAAAAALAGQAARKATATTLARIPSGWRNNPAHDQHVKFRCDEREIEIAYAFQRGGPKLSIDGTPLEDVRLTHCCGTQVQLEVAGIQRTYHVEQLGHTVYVDSPLGSCTLTEVDRFPAPADDALRGSLVAPLPGVVAEVKVAVGDAVAAGDVLMVIESMKMLHPITAPAAGKVSEIRVAPATQVHAGAILAVLAEAGE
jgi:acetyl-CoA carboxylase biotin carboxylase subunit